MKSITQKTVIAIFMLILCVGCAAAPPLKDVSYSPQFDFPSSQQKYDLKSAVYISPEFLNKSPKTIINNDGAYTSARIDVGKSAEETIKNVLDTMFSTIDFYYDQNYVPDCNKYDLVFYGQIASSPLISSGLTWYSQDTTTILSVRCPETYPSKQEFEGKSTTMFSYAGTGEISAQQKQEIAKSLTELSLKNALGEMFDKLENSSELSKIVKNHANDGQAANEQDSQTNFYSYAIPTDKVVADAMVTLEVQKRLDAQSKTSDSAKTIGQAVALGAGIGGAAGALIGGTKDDQSLLGLLVGGAIGAASGLVVGSAVAATKGLYVEKEDKLDEQISLATAQNSDQCRSNRMLSAKIRTMNDEMNSLTAQYAAGTIQFEDMQKMRDEILSDINSCEQRKSSMAQELVALNEYLNSAQKTKQEDKLAKLTHEITTLRASIETLDTSTRQLAQMVDVLSVRK